MRILNINKSIHISYSRIGYIQIWYKKRVWGIYFLNPCEFEPGERKLYTKILPHLYFRTCKPS